MRIHGAALVAVLFLALPARADDSIPDLPLECGDPIDADPATRQARAGEHYARANELYDAGYFEKSIPEFHAAYCLEPNPLPLYSIAQAYERLVEFRRAADWFERHAQALDPHTDAERIQVINRRVAVLRGLRARVRVATEPPGAAVELTAPGAEAVRGTANAAEPLRVAAGTYTLRVTLANHSPVEETVDVNIGQPYTFSYRLTPLEGRIHVVADPGTARLYLDGKIVGIGTFSEVATIGVHTLIVEADGRPGHREEIRVSAGTTSTVRVRLGPARESNGRAELLLTSAALGLSYGAAIGAVVGDSEEIYFGGGAILAASAAFGGTFFLLPDYVPSGQAALVVGGNVWGTIEGISLATFLVDRNVSERIYVPAVIGCSLAGTAIAAVAARRYRPSAGDSSIVNSGALWGGFTGALLSAAFDDSPPNPVFLAGLNGGLLAGIAFARQYDFSRGHVLYIDLGGLGGVLAGLVVGYAFGESNTMPIFVLGGTGAGLVAGALAARDVDVPIGGITPIVAAVQDHSGHVLPTFGATLEW